MTDDPYSQGLNPGVDPALTQQYPRPQVKDPRSFLRKMGDESDPNTAGPMINQPVDTIQSTNMGVLPPAIVPMGHGRKEKDPTWLGTASAAVAQARLGMVPQLALSLREAFIPAEEGYDPLSPEELRGFESIAHVLATSRSRAQSNMIKERYRLNNEAREIVDSDGGFWSGVVAMAAAPENYIPIPMLKGIGFVRGATIGAVSNAGITYGTGLIHSAVDPYHDIAEDVAGAKMAAFFGGAIGGLVGRIGARKANDLAARFTREQQATDRALGEVPPERPGRTGEPVIQTPEGEVTTRVPGETSQPGHVVGGEGIRFRDLPPDQMQPGPRPDPLAGFPEAHMGTTAPSPETPAAGPVPTAPPAAGVASPPSGGEVPVIQQAVTRFEVKPTDGEYGIAAAWGLEKLVGQMTPLLRLSDTGYKAVVEWAHTVAGEFGFALTQNKRGVATPLSVKFRSQIFVAQSIDTAAELEQAWNRYLGNSDGINIGGLNVTASLEQMMDVGRKASMGLLEKRQKATFDEFKTWAFRSRAKGQAHPDAPEDMRAFLSEVLPAVQRFYDNMLDENVRSGAMTNKENFLRRTQDKVERQRNLHESIREIEARPQRTTTDEIVLEQLQKAHSRMLDELRNVDMRSIAETDMKLGAILDNMMMQGQKRVDDAADMAVAMRAQLFNFVEQNLAVLDHLNKLGEERGLTPKQQAYRDRLSELYDTEHGPAIREGVAAVQAMEAAQPQIWKDVQTMGGAIADVLPRRFVDRQIDPFQQRGIDEPFGGYAHEMTYDWSDAPVSVQLSMPEIKAELGMELPGTLVKSLRGWSPTTPEGIVPELKHGSGAVFDRMDLSFIGTGEGTQAFGRGHYLAQRETVAESYAKDRTDWEGQARFKWKGEQFDTDTVDWKIDDDVDDLSDMWTPEEVAAEAARRLERDAIESVLSALRTGGKPLGETIETLVREHKMGGTYIDNELAVAVQKLDPNDFTDIEVEVRPQPQMYRTYLKAEPNQIIILDDALRVQTDISDKLDALMIEANRRAPMNRHFLPGADTLDQMTGEQLLRELEATFGAVDTNKIFREAGFKAIQFFDRGSRFRKDLMPKTRDFLDQFGGDDMAALAEARRQRDVAQDKSQNTIGQTQAEAIADHDAWWDLHTLTDDIEQYLKPKTYNFVALADEDVVVTHRNGEMIPPKPINAQLAEDAGEFKQAVGDPTMAGGMERAPESAPRFTPELLTGKTPPAAAEKAGPTIVVEQRDPLLGTPKQEALLAKLDEIVRTNEGLSATQKEFADDILTRLMRGDIAYSGPETDKNYINRIWIHDKVLEGRHELEGIFAKWYTDNGLNQPDAVALATQSVNDIIMATEPRQIEDLTKGSNKFIANNRARTIAIPNELVWAFVETDVAKLMRVYAHENGPAIEMAKSFGDPMGKNSIEDTLIQAAREGATRKQLAEIENNMLFLRDGTLGIMRGGSALTWRHVTVETAKNYAAVAKLGGVAVTATQEAVGTIATRGMMDTFGFIFQHYLGDRTNIKAMNQSLRRITGEGYDVEQGIQAARYTEGGDISNMRPGSHAVQTAKSWLDPFNNFVGTHFYVMNGLAHTTQFLKDVTMAISAHHMIEDIRRFAAERASKKTEDNLAAYGIDLEMARLIMTMPIQKTAKGLNLTNLGEWNNTSPEGARAIAAFAGAVAGEVRRTIVTPGTGDKSMWQQGFTGKKDAKGRWIEHPEMTIVTQFLSWSMAATQKIALSRLQGRDANALGGTVASIGLAYITLSLITDDKTWEKMSPADRMAAAVDRSGILGVFADINNRIELGSQGTFGARPLLGLQPRGGRMHNDVNQWGVGGVVPGMARELYELHANPYLTRQTQGSIVRRSLPLNGILYLKELFRQAQALVWDP